MKVQIDVSIKTPLVQKEDQTQESTIVSGANFDDETTEPLKLNILYIDKPESKKVLATKIIASGAVGIGTGLAMMPIFNYLIKDSSKFGINIHNNEVIFTISTLNTLLIYSFTSIASMYNFLKDNHQDIIDISKTQKVLISASKIGTVWSSIVPLYLLWEVELQNQQVAESHGFDKFLAWATFTTIPLLIDRYASSYNKTVGNFNQNREEITLNSIGAKLFCYGTTTLSVAGRIIVYSSIGYNLIKAMEVDETTALILGIGVGGIIGSGVTLFEHKAIKGLFQEQQESLTARKIITGTIAAIEGSWVTLPLISVGLNITENWNLLLKGALFTPLFVSHTILEATNIYDKMMSGCDSLLGCYDNMDY